MTPKALLAAAAATAMLLALPAKAAELTIGFSQIGSESGWRAAETSVSKQEAAKRKVNLKIADAQQKQENQIKAIRSFIAQNVDAIFLAPVVSTGWDAVLKEAKEAKIPVVLLDRDIDPSGKDLYLTAVTSDSVHEGAVAGEWLAKTVGGKACNIVELQGTVGASVATNRKKGFDTAIAKHANLKVVRSLPITAEFDFRQTGPQSWDIVVETEAGRMQLSGGGRRMTIDGETLAEAPDQEYRELYRRFVGLAATGASDVDLSPLRLVADAFLLGRRHIVEPFVD